MQAQTTKKMMALVRCLSPLRWFQYKEQLSVTLTNLLMMKKKKITGIQLTVLVLFLAVQKEKKKKRAMLPACTATFISTDTSADNLDQTVSGKTVSVYKEVTYL